jgi:hypothetical protein
MLDKESSGKGKRSSVAGTYENETATTRGIDENQRNQWSRLESLCLGSVWSRPCEVEEGQVGLSL